MPLYIYYTRVILSYSSKKIFNAGPMKTYIKMMHYWTKKKIQKCSKCPFVRL